MTNRELIDQANNLRRNGQNNLADKIYDQLLSAEPNNDEFIFCKAMNVTDTNPELAISLFKKAVEINPKASAAFGNITATANQCNNHNLAIAAFNDLLKKYPNNLEIIYHRAIHIGNKGDNLSALLDFYFVVDNSTMSNNPEAFLGHQIATDIALCKTQLRNETNAKPTPSVANAEKLSSVKMKEYQYSLPAKLFGNENFLIEFGKMMGWTIKEIIQKQPDYISWCILNLDNFCVSEDVIEILKRKGVNMNECEKLNLFKLKIYDNQEPKLEFDDEAPDQFSIDEDGNIIF